MEGADEGPEGSSSAERSVGKTAVVGTNGSCLTARVSDGILKLVEVEVEELATTGGL